MSLWIVFGAAMGCWAMLSVLSGERHRQKLEIESARLAQQKALLDAEASETAASEKHGH